MKKSELKYYKKEINNVKRALSLASKRLGEGRYGTAKGYMSGEAAMLQKLVSQLNEFIEQKDGMR